jgi:transposase
MRTSKIVLHGRQRQKLEREARKCRDADARVRYRIVLLAADRWSQRKIARALGCSVSTVNRTLSRWTLYGEAGLVDRREDNGQTKADSLYAEIVAWILEGSPQDHFHRRPTWTAQLLIETARQYTGVSVSLTTMGRVLKSLNVRRGRPKPTAPCPWSESARKRRVAAIQALIDTMPANHAVVWEDEADLDLNPRIGFDYMLPGTQRQVMTPGKNIKRYLAGALDAKNDRVVWVKGERKNSRLFIELLKKLLKRYADRKVIHVVLDNFIIHSSKQTRLWLEEFGQKFKLHFLPPYCPDDNRIERKVWREMHANVTINHRCQTIEELMDNAVYYLMSHNRRVQMNVRELRRAI